MARRRPRAADLGAEPGLAGRERLPAARDGPDIARRRPRARDADPRDAAARRARCCSRSRSRAVAPAPRARPPAVPGARDGLPRDPRLVFVAGGKSYSSSARCRRSSWPRAHGVDGWLAARAGGGGPRSGSRAAGSLALVAVLTLPVLPATTLADSPIPDIYAENAEQVGWPELVGTDAGAWSPGCQADERARAHHPHGGTTASRARSSSWERTCRRSIPATTAPGPGGRRTTRSDSHAARRSLGPGLVERGGGSGVVASRAAWIKQ